MYCPFCYGFCLGFFVGGFFPAVVSGRVIMIMIMSEHGHVSSALQLILFVSSLCYSRISARLCGATVLGGSVRPSSCQLLKVLPAALIW